MIAVTWAEVAAAAFESTRPITSTPGELAVMLDPLTVQTPMLRLIDDQLVDVMQTSWDSKHARGARKIILCPVQEGKSQRIARRFPLWALLHNPNLRIAVTSYESELARRWGRAIMDDIIAHPELGLRISHRIATQHEWELAGYRGGVYTAGAGRALTGRPVDLLIVDDPVKSRDDADSELQRERIWEWFHDVALRRLSPGAPVILVMTRWHPDDLAGRLIRDGGWDVTTIPAQCEDATIDPLGREVGEFLESARGTTAEQWEGVKESAPLRTWLALYQQRPAPASGLVFQWDWIDKNRKPSGEGRADFIRTLVAVDPAATSKSSSDYTGIVVVALDSRGHAWVLDDRTVQGTPQQWAHAAWSALLHWNADEIVVESNMGGEMTVHVLSTMWETLAEKQRYARMRPRVTPVTATQSKRIRAEAIAALYQVGKIHHADDGTGRLRALEEQMTTWTGHGDSPDRIDALAHGITALFTPRDGVLNRPPRTRTR